MRSLFFLVAMSISSFSAAQMTSSLAEIEVELNKSQSLPLSNQIAFELVSHNVGGTEKTTSKEVNIRAYRLSEGSQAINMDTSSHLSGKVNDRHSSSSFVIDLDDEDIKNFVAEFLQSNPQPRRIENLTKYVNEYIDNPTYIHGFNIASTVVEKRSGDCTEYAVLAAALARSLDIPARVILGSVIMEEQGQVRSFGHAWVEIWGDERWHIADAALYNSDAIQIFYLPSMEINNEGPGYSMSLLQAAKLLPIKIRHLRDL